MAAETFTVDSLLAVIRRDGVRRSAQALRKPPIPSRLLQELAERADVPDARQFVAAYPLAPSHLLETLAQTSPDPAVLGWLATNPRTPPHLLTAFAAHADAPVRAQAALHPQLPPRELLNLATDPAPAVRTAVAANPALRLPHQAVLAADTEPAVRLRLAGQAVVPKPVALVLGADASGVVRLHTVAAARVEDDVLLGWAATDEEEVQLALARREPLPAAVLRTLFYSPHPAVRRAVRTRAATDEADLLFLATHGEPEERAWVAQRDLLARPLQGCLAQDGDAAVRVALAGNVSLDPEIARYFVGQAEALVCAALAVNPVVPLDLVQELVATKHPEVLAALAYREILEAELVPFLLRHSADFRNHWAWQQRPLGDLDLETARLLVADALPAVRALGIAGCPYWRLADLYDLARDPAATVRLAAVRHPKAGDDLLAQREADADPAVAAAAGDLRAARERNRAEALRAQLAGARNAPLPAAPVRAAEPAPRPATKLVARSSPGLLNQLKRIFWQ
jgi:hypothetical protein